MKNHKAFEIPSFIYGTAWKEESTSELVQLAVRTGFTAIDTANQKKHYREDYVGNALLELAKTGIQRKDLFLQSKYTYVEGQDHRLPYNPSDSFQTQVKDSFQSSLKNLHTDYLDSYLIHGPSSYPGLDEADWEVWNTMEELYEAEQVRMIGVSNVNFQQISELFQKATIKPMVVQNRCFANRGWDLAVREFCLANDIIYQGFSLLTANPQILGHPSIRETSRRLNVTPQQLIFRFSKQIGILPLTGTTKESHMREDLKADTFEISSEDMALIHSLSG